MWWWFVQLTHVSPPNKLIFIIVTQVFSSGDLWHPQTTQCSHIKELSKMVLFSVAIIFTALSVWDRGGSQRSPLVTLLQISINNTASVCHNCEWAVSDTCLTCHTQWHVTQSLIKCISWCWNVHYSFLEPRLMSANCLSCLTTSQKCSVYYHKWVRNSTNIHIWNQNGIGSL